MLHIPVNLVRLRTVLPPIHVTCDATDGFQLEFVAPVAATAAIRPLCASAPPLVGRLVPKSPNHSCACGYMRSVRFGCMPAPVQLL